jgi:predicted permease
VSPALAARVAPLFVGFFGLMAVGLGLRRGLRGAVTPAAMSAALTALVLDVTAPLLVLDVLLRAPLTGPLALALVAPTAALGVALGLARAAAAALRVDRPAAGAMLLAGAFSNTGFMGIPLAQGLQPDRPAAAQAAVLIDTVDTTALLWTLGAALAARFGEGGGRGDLPSVLRSLAARPLSWAVALGLGLNALGASLPWWLRPGVERAGAATGPLVFVVLGLNVDLARLRGRGAALAATVALRLAVAPAVAFAVTAALGLRGPAAWAGVMQAAMPTALAATVLAAQHRCDAALASAACAVGMALAPLSLTAWAALAEGLW